MSPLLNYTTSVPVDRTITEIQRQLVKHGARQVLMDWGADGRVKGLSFIVPVPSGHALPFRLPVDAEATQKVLEAQWGAGKIKTRRYTEPEHAYKVAWRCVKDWVEAQLALLETGMVRLEQIFLPYLVMQDNKTVYELMTERNFFLPEGRGEEEQ